MNHVLVTGGAGFLGSHLCRALLDRGDRVTTVDNFGTGRYANIAGFTGHPRFTLRTADTTTLGCFADLDRITHLVHLAYPGSPTTAARHATAALRAASTGTLAALDLAASHNARIVLASGPEPATAPEHLHRTATPDVHAAGHRLLESAARNYRGADIAIARLPDVYGPHLWPGDGRITSAICAAALRDQSLYFASDRLLHPLYVTDAVAALIRMLDTENPAILEITAAAVPLTRFARTAVTSAGRGWLEIHPAATCLDIPEPVTLTAPRAGQPVTPLPSGIRSTLDWMRSILSGPREPRPAP
ncbi:NAD-dependent epimerase/dehydratase family protein [Nocardia sp. NPDC024068]|uniref:NAD-dependent epimerase/dehydratase family protein n=1 Tax=Nocardia sp. NPDC024068 TaxID=3157197 RepID=UPI0033DF1909